MCTGIALDPAEVPMSLVERHRLAERRYDRDGHVEYQFHWWQVPTVLPVRRHGRLDVLPWGSKLRRGPLPYGGWLSVEHLKAGVLGCARLYEVVIPANLGQERGTWFLIAVGIRGVTVETKVGPVVYMLVQPSSNYYRNFAEQVPMMPVFVDQVI